jgi:capsular polysaccharide transport system permease protein
VDEATRRGDLATDPAADEAAAAALPARRKLVVARTEPSRVPAEERNKVVHIVRRLEEETSHSRTRNRRPWMLISVLAAIALPTFIAAIFYIFIASDRYVSEARFAVRNNETQAVDALGMITGMPSSQLVSDSYIVADYVVGRDMVVELERRLPFRTMYSKADFFSRVSPTATLEELITYWQKHVDVYYDSTKNVVIMQIQAFDPEDADKLARTIVDIVRNLVNNLSAQARRDAVEYAASEVARAELRVRGARADILKFRVTHNDLDPTQTASATLGIAAGLEGERSKLLSDLASVSGYLADDAPSVQMLKSRIKALTGEIARIQGQVSDASNEILPQAEDDGLAAVSTSPTGRLTPTKVDALATSVGTYQELALSQDFAEKAYTAAMASLEHARSEVTRTQSYLAIYAQPSVAEQATYPRRGMNIFLVFVLSCVLWGIGMLGTLTIRDHIA